MATPKHTDRKHALLSASGASRWLNCTPSARLEEKFNLSNPEKPNVYADEGTLAHEFGDLNLRYLDNRISKTVHVKEIATLRKHSLYSPEMETEIEKYTGYVMEQYAVAREKNSDAVLLIEEKLDFSHIVEQGFGTGDACVIADGILEIIDLKYGKGIAVSAKENEQLKLYALGALNNFEMLYDIHTIRLTIIQPRMDNFSSWDISVQDLENWASKVVKPAAIKAYAGEGKQQCGDWCKWCKVKSMCATIAAKNVAFAKHEFKDPHLLTDKQILEVFQQIPMLQDWANAVADYLLDTALKGKEWKGYKLVEGRSQRKWLDKEEVIEILSAQKGLKKSDYISEELMGIPAIEKLVGKAEFPKLLGGQVVVPQGKPTLVPQSDKRPALGIAQAKIDFAD